MLTLSGITVSFGGIRAVDGASMEFAAGAVSGVIGPNGAGKTTLLNIISGLLQADSGTIHFAGEAIESLPPHERARRGLGRTFQTPRIFDELDAIENVACGAYLHGRKGGARRSGRGRSGLRDLVLAAFETVGLGAQARALSGIPISAVPFGTLRFIEIARALLPEPRMILLDEPAAGLDIEERDRLRTIITGLAARGMGVVLIEHDVAFLLSVADRVSVLHQGRLVAEGPGADIQRNELVRQIYLGPGSAHGADS